MNEQLSPSQLISARILMLLMSGVSIDKAYDAVLGDGAFVKLANDTHEALNTVNQ